MMFDSPMPKVDEPKHLISLDGGGVHGYFPIKVVQELITEKYLSDITEFDYKNSEHRKQFNQAQINFNNQFDYIAGSSTGGLLAFCLAINYDILDIKDIYTRTSYFHRNFFQPSFSTKNDLSRIHDKIDEIIGTITLKNGKRLSAKNATLLDIHHYLNPDAFMPDDILNSNFIHNGGLIEAFHDVDDDMPNIFYEDNKWHRVNHKKALLITGFNATEDIFTMFNTSSVDCWRYRIADVLKATMAAATYFPPQKISKGLIENGHFISNKSSSLIFIDDGICANDPELSALSDIKNNGKNV